MSLSSADGKLTGETSGDEAGYSVFAAGERYPLWQAEGGD